MRKQFGMKKSITAVWRIASALVLAGMTACGGGGGGAPPADVQGRILTVSGGSPVANATVSIGGASQLTKSDGTFLFRGVSSSATQISVTSTGNTALTQNLPTLAAQPALNDLGDIFVTSDGYTAIVKSKVVRSDTLAAVAGARVRIAGQFATTAADGTFTISGLPVFLGTAAVPVGLIKATGLEDKTIILDLPLGDSSGTPPVPNILPDIVMSPPVGSIPGDPSNLKGTITFSAAAASGVTVTLINKSTTAVVDTRLTGTDGKYGFFAAAGTYIVKAERTGAVTQQKEVTIASPSDVKTVDFALLP
jgi:hypothetical protein